MSFLNKLKSVFRKVAPSRGRRGYVRSYQGAKTGDLVADWLSGTTSADAELYASNPKLRDRARQLDRDNPYARNYIHSKAVKVARAQGIRLQMNITLPGGDPDDFANDLIEAAWKSWGKIGIPTMAGMASGVMVQHLIEKALSRDGEMFVRLFSGRKKIQLLEGDYVDYQKNGISPDGNQIIMGVEYDKFKKPLFYYLLSDHPGEVHRLSSLAVKYIRVPAAEIIHVFIQHRAGQTRGEPPMAPGMYDLHMLKKFTEGEVIAGRNAANVSIFVKHGSSGSDSIKYDEEDDAGNRIAETEPGQIWYGTKDQDVKMLAANHPNSNHAAFSKTQLRAFGAAVKTPYERIANDREGVNFSSIRTGTVDDNNVTQVDQMYLKDLFLERLFAWWLPLMLLDELSALTFSRVDQYIDAATWVPPGFEWVDPLKDAQADDMLVKGNYITKQHVISKRTGENYQDVLRQRKKEIAAEIEVEKMRLELLGIKDKIENGGQEDA